jgi:hypothetical protein
VVGCSPSTVKAAVASFGPPRYLRAATGSLVDGFEPRIRELLRPFFVDAGDGESRSGSANGSDSLIEFVKTNVAILPLLILTATTASDELSYRLKTLRLMVSGSARIGRSTGERRLLTRCFDHGLRPIRLSSRMR